jgi:DNA invertase Pin-like site-specific DNA recombinase
VTPRATGTAWAYTRVSTHEQSIGGLGLGAQRSVLSAEVSRRGWPKVEWVSDDGFSGKDLARPGLTQVLAQIRAGDVLAVAKLDRLSRSLFDFAGVMDCARREGWSLVVLDLGVDTTSAAGEMLANVMASFAQYERRLIGERTAAALAARKAQGMTLGRPVEIPSVVEGQIVALRAKGLSMAAVAQQLNVDGVTTARGGRWHASTIKRVLDRSARSAPGAPLPARHP